MAMKISAVAFLALISAVSAQTPGFDAITTPLAQEAVPACADYVINWDYTSAYPETISIQLLEGATSGTLQLGPVIASGIDNSLGQYTWAVDCSLGADATYGLKIIYSGDSTGATFQYSNPFQITAASSSSSSSSAAAAATTSTSAAAVTSAAVTTSSAPTNEDEVSSTLFSTEYVTITSCAATVTDCPARSTVVSSYVSAVTSAAATSGAGAISANSSPSGAPASGAPVPSSFSSVSPVVTGKPYPAGNGTVPTGGMGTVTISKPTTGSGSSPSSATTSGSSASSSSPATAGAGKVAAGSLAAVAGLMAAVFAL